MAIIKGNKFDVIINKESSRKTLNAVGFTKSMERVFGNRASSLQVRNDDRVFKFASSLLGKQFGDELIESKKNFFPYKLVKLEGRDTYGISITNKTNEVVFSVEEIIAMLLEHGKEATEAFTSGPIKDCVITVPSYWTHHQRKALVYAANLAGLNVLSVINELSAVALEYSISRKFEGTENVIFYDLGEASAKASVVSFSKFLNEKNKTVTQVRVLSSKWDTSIGVRDLENNLIQYFADLINKDKASHKYTGGDIRKHKGAMGKLSKETRRTKEVLSANTETIVSVEGIIGEYDFRTQVSREIFENINSKYWDQLVDLARVALKDADVDVKDLAAFELVGGGIRIPRVYESLRKFYGRDSLDRHLNGDESACQGASYYAVTKSIAFKTQGIELRDINLYPISVKILDEDMKDNKKVFFGDRSKFDDKKYLSFRTFNNTLVRFDYEPSKILPKGTPLPLSLYNITGMPTSAEFNFTTTPKITATVLFKNGVVSIEKAEVRFRYATTQKITKKIKKEEKSKKTEEENIPPTPTTTEESKETAEEAKKEEKASDSKKTTEKGAEKEKEKTYEEIVVYEPVNKTKTINLIVHETSLGFADFTAEKIAEIKKRYNRINKVENHRVQKQKALNDLESYILNNRDALEEKPFVEASTESEREAIKQTFENNLEWLEEDGSSAALKELEKRIKEVKKDVERVQTRISEATAFPQAIQSCRTTVNFTRILLENITQTLEVTEEEKKDGLNDANELETWLTEKETEQGSVKLFEDPKVTSATVNSKCSIFTSLSRRLLGRRKKVPKKETTNTTESTNSTSANSTSAGDSKKKDSTTEETTPQTEKDEEIL
eukprot:TRINITY_DN6307_c0_g1_i1.p1 TRINITY_DN6307_c0_g1~~TRINITY_DN6307_c0_g1_i1.p1  ORF type:complete len:872 (-),score=327.47 TRINITY_DN6307_c0_g1_i1:29-2548(-)